MNLEVRNLHLTLGGRHLVRGLDFDLPAGSFLAVSGPSGCGKTTMLHNLAGFSDEVKGEVVYTNSKGAWLPSDFPDQIGFIYQHFRLSKPMSALGNACCGALGHLAWHRTLFGFPFSVRRTAYQELCGLGLKEAAFQPVAQLSGGERQRVAIARALHQKPLIYYADEPVANLDRTNAHLVLARFRRECAERKVSVIAVLHDDPQISLFADYVLRWDNKEGSLWKMERIRK